jgi:hypothetical protein
MEGLSGPAETFAERLARIDPLAPVAYCVLASRALEDGTVPDERTVLARVGAMERERAASHLNWLASFAHLLGYCWLEERAGELQLALLRAAGWRSRPPSERAGFDAARALAWYDQGGRDLPSPWWQELQAARRRGEARPRGSAWGCGGSHPSSKWGLRVYVHRRQVIRFFHIRTNVERDG